MWNLGDPIKRISDPVHGISWLLLSRSSRPELLMHRPAQFLIGDVEVSLRRLQIGMTEKQLNRSQVETLGEPAAGALVAQVVPVQVDLGRKTPKKRQGVVRRVAGDVRSMSPRQRRQRMTVRRRRFGVLGVP